MSDFIITNNILEKYTGADVEVTIPEGVRAIEYRAFYRSKNLQSVIIPEGVKYIGGEAFKDCKNLQSVTIPKSIKTIAGWAFEGCSKLQNITVPESTRIEEFAFSGCRTLADQNKMIILNRTVFQYLGRKASVAIPEGIASIATAAFLNCSSIQEIFIPETITSIGERAFCQCQHLRRITLPKNVNRIGESTFAYCENLESVSIPESITEIENTTFAGCVNLQSVSIPDSVMRIGYAAFANCSNLQTVSIGNGIRHIDGNAFPKEMPLRQCVLAPDSQDEEQCKILLDILGTRNLAFSFLSDTLETNEIIRKSLKTRVTNKKFREKFTPTLIEQNESKTFANFLSLIKKMPVEEIDGYIQKSENAPEIRMLLMEYKNRLYPTETIKKMEEIQAEKDLGLREKTLADYKKEFSITKGGDFYKITGYKGENENVVIPSTIRGIPVKITDEAFFGCNQLREVYMENGITDIGSRLFANCKNLQS
ncbi:MAG: hypothetical protein E7603_06940, partial [Ruminococcaceae bacterium]|nr:hypothetical protein [Oscillospiraceae bacterium]